MEHHHFNREINYKNDHGCNKLPEGIPIMWIASIMCSALNNLTSYDKKNNVNIPSDHDFPDNQKKHVSHTIPRIKKRNSTIINSCYFLVSPRRSSFPHVFIFTSPRSHVISHINPYNMSIIPRHDMTTCG